MFNAPRIVTVILLLTLTGLGHCEIAGKQPDLMCKGPNGPNGPIAIRVPFAICSLLEKVIDAPNAVFIVTGAQNANFEYFALV